MHRIQSEHDLHIIKDRLAQATDAIADLVNTHTDGDGDWPDIDDLTEDQKAALTYAARAQSLIAGARYLIDLLLEDEWRAKNAPALAAEAARKNAVIGGEPRARDFINWALSLAPEKRAELEEHLASKSEAAE